MTSDRLVFAGAAVPIAAGVIALALLQRVAPVRFPEAKAAVTVQPATAVPTAKNDAWVGVIVAGYTAELAAEADARVTQVFVKSGSRVAEGEKLLQFDEAEAATSFGMANAELRQKGSELIRAQANADAAKARLGRVTASAQWLSSQEMDTARAEERVAEADLRAARAAVSVGQARVSQQKLRVSRRTLVAPFAGSVVGVDVDPGDSVSPGQVVVRVVSEDRQVRFAVPPGALSGSSVVQGAERAVSIRLAGTSLSVDTFVSSVRPEVDPSAHLVFATAKLPESLPEVARWLPGESVEVFLAPQVVGGGSK
jgi:multidrug efflux pump subunit AcrA (membrane-fusion protein)